eukprot:10843905-Alexandrium_andersonii.AAC.1
MSLLCRRPHTSAHPSRPPLPHHSLTVPHPNPHTYPPRTLTCTASHRYPGWWTIRHAGWVSLLAGIAPV